MSCRSTSRLFEEPQPRSSRLRRLLCSATGCRSSRLRSHRTTNRHCLQRQKQQHRQPLALLLRHHQPTILRERSHHPPRQIARRQIEDAQHQSGRRRCHQSQLRHRRSSQDQHHWSSPHARQQHQPRSCCPKTSTGCPQRQRCPHQRPTPRARPHRLQQPTNATSQIQSFHSEPRRCPPSQSHWSCSTNH